MTTVGGGKEPDYRTNKNKKGYRVIKTTEGNECESEQKYRLKKGVKDRQKQRKLKKWERNKEIKYERKEEIILIKDWTRKKTDEK